MAEKEFERDQERLAKLWDAYENQERELDLAMKKISDLENKIKEYERINSTLKSVVETRDKEIRDLEIKVVTLEEEATRFQPQIDELTRLYKDEKERYAKLFVITEELEEDLASTKKELEIRDLWFKNNIGVMTNLSKSIRDRDMMVKEIKTKKLDVPPPPSVSENLAFENLAKSSTPDTKPEEDKVTFENMTPSKDEDSPASTTEENTDPPKPDVINQFTQVEDITAENADALHSSGYTSIEKLKAATTEELAKVDGISPTLARKIRTALL
jgi:predicted flap endonuclease-1-like 5' DNA nuclease